MCADVAIFRYVRWSLLYNYNSASLTNHLALTVCLLPAEDQTDQREGTSPSWKNTNTRCVGFGSGIFLIFLNGRSRREKPPPPPHHDDARKLYTYGTYGT